MFQWRRFQFFEKDQVKEEEKGGSVIDNIDISCATSGRGKLIFGDSEGCVTFVDRGFKLSTVQLFNENVSHLYQLKSSSTLVAIGYDEPEEATIKFFDTEKTTREGIPLLLRTLKILGGKLVGIPVSALAVVEGLTHMAVGFEDGTILLLRGDIVRDRYPSKRILRGQEVDGEKAKHQQQRITELGFREQVQSMALFATTPDTVEVFVLGGRNEIKEILDEQGCVEQCATLSDHQDLVVARQEAIYIYEAEGRGPCFAFDGEKSIVSWFRGYAVVAANNASIGTPASALTTPTPPPSSLPLPKQTQISIYDLRNKFIAFSGTFGEVKYILPEWGSIFLICADKNKSVFRLEEKDMQTKLEMLFRKNLYSVAINLARMSQYDANAISEIFRKYGDHLYSKGDFDGAMAQYLKTIGRLEPSYVIRKFLDAQRIHNLTNYLQSLHEKDLATADHTTLLLNCHSKLKDVKKLDEFIRTDAELHFDVETAIKVLRHAGYHDHAVYLASKHNDHDWYLKIQLEDLKRYGDALNYMAQLDTLEAEKYLKKYGKLLVTKLPRNTTDLLKKLCTVGSSGNIPTHPTEHEGVGGEIDEDGDGRGEREGIKARPEDFVHIYVDQPDWLQEFLESIVKSSPEVAAKAVYDTLLELYLRDADSKKRVSSEGEGEEGGGEEEGRAKEEEARSKRLDKALDLLKDTNANYDIDHALVLCQLHSFRPGVLYLYEKLKLYHEIVQMHMEHDDSSAILQACMKYGGKEPSLWIQVLSHFAMRKVSDGAQGEASASTSTASSAAHSDSEITEVLAAIDRDNIVPPLVVIQILSKSDCTLGLVKDYIVRRLHRESQLILEDQQQIRQYTEETQKMRAQIEELHTSARIFQLNKCTLCSTVLDLPAIHFLCGHSFHHRCLGENERECPSCAPENRRVLDIKRNLEQSVDQHDLFFRQLDGSVDGFSTIAEYFGRGIFSKVVLLPSEGKDKGDGSGMISTPAQLDAARQNLFS